jgi:phage terminase large subunit GpA-like protein
MERQSGLKEMEVPDWAVFLTGGVDVQETTLYWTIRAWGPYITSQCIAHGQVLSFGDVESIMNMQYKRSDGEMLVVSLCLVDSGYDADTTYEFCVMNSEWALPVKGSSNAMLSYFKLSKINKAESSAYGMTLVIVDGDKYKDMIASRMKKKNGQGSWMVYKGCDQEYAEQVTAEHKVNVKTQGGRVIQKWVPKRSHIDNHYLDTEVYAIAAADILGVRTLHLRGEEEKNEPPAPVQPDTPEENWIRKNENWL